MSKIYQIYGNDAHIMTEKLLDAAHAIDLVPHGGSVALKPNLVIAGTPESGSTTHAGILSGCIEYFSSKGVTDISVIEGSWVGDDTMRAMRKAGYDKICDAYNVPFYDLKRDKTRPVSSAIGDISVCCRALDAGLLIDLPVLKGHCQTIMTCALKNLKGCLPDKEKRRFHTMGLTRPIAALGAALKPRLIVVDSICGDLDFEEGGTPIETNRMMLGNDAVQMDAYGASLMGLHLSDVPYIQLAEQFGGGSTVLREDDLIELNAPTVVSTYPKPSGTVARLCKNVHADSACSACYAALIRALHNGNAGRHSDISIGQGYRGKSFEGIGVGNCCRGATQNIPGCPPKADAIAEALENFEWQV